ncbi:MAG TPA: 3-deoxy-D-manno-octulosonic acid transferase [Deltaproteobacteria bacterium]|nr:3-deoxy-D-manno-octulosonic acid transferase [Deltaproteobacteria bacterium]
MTRFVYEIVLHIGFLAMVPYFLFMAAAARKYRRGLPERLGMVPRRKLAALEGGPVVWVHAVSVGETRAVIPLVRMLKERRPQVKVLFSTVTATANDVAAAEGKGLIDALVYCPLDFSWAVGRLIDRAAPRVFVVVEKEVWPNLLLLLRRSGAATVVVNGTVSERSFESYRRFGFFFREVFGSLSAFCARTEEDAARAEALGVEPGRVTVAGNIKFDMGARTAGCEARADELRRALCVDGGPVIVAGSTHRGEEEILLRLYGSLRSEFPELRLFIVPRHPERFDEVEALAARSGFSYVRRSAGGRGDIVVVDTVGELSALYSLADVAVVCGSLVRGVGGHNLLEPAFFSRPVLYGPYIDSYRSMAALLEAGGGGLRAAGESDMLAKLRRLLREEGAREEMGRRAKAVVDANRGAAARCVDTIEAFLDDRGAERGG